MEANDSFHLPKVSVVIASFNSESHSYLRRCLESIKKQDYEGEIEIVVADGGSTDCSVSTAVSFGATVVHNSQVTELGFNGGKNLGIKYSTGDLIAIVDADNILINSDYLSKMIMPLLEDNEISMTLPLPYVPSRSECTSVCFYFCRMEREIYESMAKSGVSKGSWAKVKPDNIVVSNGAIIRRSVLEKIGGWDYDTETGFRLVKNGFDSFGIVYSAERFHLEMLHLEDVWRKYKRRINDQIKNGDNKSVSQNAIDRYIENPSSFIVAELLFPIRTVFRRHKKIYPTVLAVFFIKIFVGFYYIILSRKNLVNSQKNNLLVP